MKENNLYKAFQELTLRKEEIYDLLTDITDHLLKYAKQHAILSESNYGDAINAIKLGKKNYDTKRWFPGPFTKPIIKLSEENKSDLDAISTYQSKFFRNKDAIRVDEFEQFYLTLNKEFALPDIIGIGFTVPQFARNFSHAINVHDHTRISHGLFLITTSMLLRIRDLSPTKIRNEKKFINLWGLISNHHFGKKLNIAEIYVQNDDDSLNYDPKNISNVNLKINEENKKKSWSGTIEIKKIISEEVEGIKKDSKVIAKNSNDFALSLLEHKDSFLKINNKLDNISKKLSAINPSYTKSNDTSTNQKQTNEHIRTIEKEKEILDNLGDLVESEEYTFDESNIKHLRKNTKQNLAQLSDRLWEIRNEINQDYNFKLEGFQNILNSAFLREMNNNKIKNLDNWKENKLINERFGWNKTVMLPQIEKYWSRIQLELDNTNWDDDNSAVK